MNNKKVIWSEGLFIQPQHFQQQERYVEDLIAHRATHLGKYFWGCCRLKIDLGLLTLGKMAVLECAGVFSDGTVFDVPITDESPLPLEVPTGIHDTVVYLAIPLRRAGCPDVGMKNSTDTYRYHVGVANVSDNNSTGGVEAQIQVGDLNLRLVLGSEDLTAYTCIAIAKIKESCFDRSIILDDNFIPSCVDLHSSTVLTKFMVELTDLLRYRGETLAQLIVSDVHNATSEMLDFMLLQIVNKWQPYLTHLMNLSNIHPSFLYGILLLLAGELAVFTRAERRPLQLPIYDHYGLQQTFSLVFAELRRSLSMVLEQNAIAIKLEERQYGVWVAAVADKTLFGNAIFVLAVYADVPINDVKAQFSAQVKIASVEHIRNLVTKALPGIDLQLLTIPPRQIPYHTKYAYFMLNNSHSMWTSLAKSGGIAFHVSGDFPGLKLELWAVHENGKLVIND